MNEKCLDIGTIQAFLDGETKPEVSLRLADHIGGCKACTDRLAVAEDENSFVFSALDREMNTLVPTQRLWNRINDSIEIEKASAPYWHQFVAFVSTSFSSPTMTAAAGLLIVFGLISAVWMVRSTSDVASGDVRTFVTPAPDAGPVSPRQEPSNESNPTRSASTGPSYVAKSELSEESVNKLVEESNRRNEIRPQSIVHQPLPSEVGYIKTIAGLKESLDGRRDEVFDPSSRVAFERDLAVVNNAIQRTQKVARKNPRNQAARQVLYSAYQDKIDLLNTVAQRDELMASTR